MNFLNSGLLSILLPLVALPVVIHLLNKHFPRKFMFSAVQYLKESMARQSRLHRWRHLLLLLIRTMAIALLLTAFLKPVHYRFGGGSAAQRHVLIMFDHSLSMEHHGDGPTSRERAAHEAAGIIKTLGPGDLLNIILIERQPSTCFVDFSKNHNDALHFLKQLKPGLTRADVNAANGLAARFLAKVKGPADVYYLSDFQRKNWSAVDFSMLPATARLFFVDVGPKALDNRAILEAHASQAQALAGEAITLEITVGNFSSKPFSDKLVVSVDRRLSVDQELFIAPWSVGKVSAVVPAGMPGLRLCEITLPADALEADNRYCLTLPVQEKEEVLIICDDSPEDRKSPAFYLKTALNPFDDLRGPLLPRVIASSEVTMSRLAGVKTIFLTHLSRLGEEAAAALAGHLMQGAGIIYFLDTPADAGSLAALERPIGPNTMPLQLVQWRTATNILTGAQQVVRGDFKSRFLKMFRGAGRQDLGLLEVYDYWQARATGAGNVLLVYGDESPAMAVTTHGLGTLLLVNFSPAESASNLARQRLFPAWVQEMVKAVAVQEPPPDAYTLGETVHVSFWKDELRQSSFVGPSGKPVRMKVEVDGERCKVSFVPEEPGFYTLGGQKPVEAVAVNTSPDESDLRPVDKELLPAQAAGKEAAQYVSGLEDFEEVARGRPLAHWFALAAIGLLVLESAFQWMVSRAAPVRVKS